MDFAALQLELQDNTLDTSSEYGVGGTGNKKALNKGLDMLFQNVKHIAKVNRYFKTNKTEVSVVNKVVDLPVDFDSILTVSIFDFQTDSDVDGISDGRVFDFEIRGQKGAKKMYLEDLGYSKLYIQYIPIQEELVDNTDVPILPEELHGSIVDFGLFFYHRYQRDLPAAADALSLAQQILEQRISTLG